VSEPEENQRFFQINGVLPNFGHNIYRSLVSGLAVKTDILAIYTSNHILLDFTYERYEGNSKSKVPYFLFK
jgi:hypothetical protein